MVVKLKKPYTVDLGTTKQKASLIIPANETFVAESSGGEVLLSLEIQCGTRRVELRASLAKDAVEVVVP